MDLIHNNPYRVLGVLASASEKDKLRLINKATKLISIGKQVDSDFDFPFLINTERSESTFRKASSSIEQNQDKVNNSLFWFLKANPFDETAINYLKNGDKDKAVDIWSRVTDGKAITSRNFSCLSNLGTLKLLEGTKEAIKEGIDAKVRLIQSASFKDFVDAVGDYQTYTTSTEEQLRKFIDSVLNQLKGKYTSLGTLELFSGCDETTQKYLVQKFTEEPLHNIESQIESTKKQRKSNKRKGYELGLKLYRDTKKDLFELSNFLSKNNLSYKSIADKLANELLQCGIDYFNEFQKDSSRGGYLESSQELTKLADSIAVGKLTKDRVKDSIETLENMRDQELVQALAILSAIKLAYEEAINKIDIQVAELRLRMRSNESIDYSKVRRLKAQCLNWDKVVEVVGKAISPSDVEIIKNSSNEDKVLEYKKLVDFLFGVLSSNRALKLSYLCYWKKIQEKPTSGCYIATMAYGHYDHPQVMELRNFRDNILDKSMLGRKFINFYYCVSPFLVEIFKDKPKVNKFIREFLDGLIKILRK